MAATFAFREGMGKASPVLIAANYESRGASG